MYHSVLSVFFRKDCDESDGSDGSDEGEGEGEEGEGEGEEGEGEAGRSSGRGHDGGVKKAAAAMLVGVGSLSDPHDCQVLRFAAFRPRGRLPRIRY